MSVLASIRSQVVPVSPEGYPFISAFALASLVLLWLWSPLGWISVMLTAWCFYFFRDPPRVARMRRWPVWRPGEGGGTRIPKGSPPAERERGDKPVPRISIFVSVFDCHVNRSPVTGRIERMAYRPGAFVNADLDKASDDNERNCLVITTGTGAQVGVVQIAGLIERSIVHFVKQGTIVGAGDSSGMIRFGSR